MCGAAWRRGRTCQRRQQRGGLGVGGASHRRGVDQHAALQLRRQPRIHALWGPVADKKRLHSLAAGGGWRPVGHDARHAALAGLRRRLAVQAQRRRLARCQVGLRGRAAGAATSGGACNPDQDTPPRALPACRPSPHALHPPTHPPRQPPRARRTHLVKLGGGGPAGLPLVRRGPAAVLAAAAQHRGAVAVLVIEGSAGGGAAHGPRVRHEQIVAQLQQKHTRAGGCCQCCRGLLWDARGGGARRRSWCQAGPPSCGQRPARPLHLVHDGLVRQRRRRQRLRLGPRRAAQPGAAAGGKVAAQVGQPHEAAESRGRQVHAKGVGRQVHAPLLHQDLQGGGRGRQGRVAAQY